MNWTRVLLAVALWALLLPALASFAQDTEQQGETAAQTVAQGIMAMPAETMIWQSELQRAVISPRAEAMPQTGGFVVADTGALAITDADGKLLQRLAPGEASWIEPGAVRAIVSLETRSVGYLRISLIPASFLPEEPGAASHGDPFPAPSAMAALGLIRDTLNNAEELVVASGDAPALLQVTTGKVFVLDESGEIVEVSAGSPFQFQGPVTLSGASRVPASLVVARLGPQVPVHLALFDPNATPEANGVATPLATPSPQDERATLSVEAWLCPPGYDESSPLLSCTGAAAGVRFTAEDAGDPVSVLTDESGMAVLPDLASGTVTLRATLPDGATTAVASCRNLRGDALGRVRDDALTLSLESGAQVSCSWFIEPGQTWPAATLSAAVLACPPGMTAQALHPEYCLPTDQDVVLQLSVEDANVVPAQANEGFWVWGPLLERRYELTLTHLSPGFSEAVLDNGTRGMEGEPMRIDLNEELTPVRTVYLIQPPDANAVALDSDADLLTDAQELELGTDPYLADSDGDGLVDGDETGFYGTEPLLADTDEDGLGDQEEVATYFTNPFLPDTDGDGVGDFDEVTALTNPLDMLSLPPTPTPEPTSTPSPSPTPLPTSDASPVAMEGTPAGAATATPFDTETRVPAALPTLSPEASPISHRSTQVGTPVAASVGEAGALDDDGLTTLEEVAKYGTDPLNPDTDGDGMNDGDEVASGRDPLDAAN